MSRTRRAGCPKENTARRTIHLLKTGFVQASAQSPRSSTNLWERYGEGDIFLSIFNRFWRHVRLNRAFSQSGATENASPFRSPPGNPAGFQGIGPSHQKRYFFDGLGLCASMCTKPLFYPFSLFSLSSSSFAAARMPRRAASFALSLSAAPSVSPAHMASPAPLA